MESWIFLNLSKPFGSYVCADEESMKQTKLEVAIIIIRSSCAMVINEVLRVIINGVEFRVKVMEEGVVPLRLVVPDKIRMYFILHGISSLMIDPVKKRFRLKFLIQRKMTT